MATDRVQVRHHTRYGGRVLRPGDEVTVPSTIALRWVSRGIAVLTDDQGTDTDQGDAAKAPSALTQPPAGTPLPEGFPERGLLEAYGFLTVEAVRDLKQEDLVALKGIGVAKAKTILKAAGEA